MRILATLLLMAASGSALAVDTFRCRNDLVQVGDPKSSVLVKCGEPYVRDSSCQPGTGQGPIRVTNPDGKPIMIDPPCENVDEWTYKPSVGDFYTTIRMERGVITSIKYGDRVK